MAIDFTANGQGIKYTSNVANGLTTYSISTWYYARGNGYTPQGGCVFNIGQTGAPTYPWGVMNLFIADATVAAMDNDLSMSVTFDGNEGTWYTNSAPSLNAWHHAVITYDNTSSGNNPIFYIDRSPAAITEYSTPAGNAVTSSDFVGVGFLANINTFTLEGQCEDLRLYNRILTQADVNRIYDERILRNAYSESGLIFHPAFMGAKGMSTFDGKTLAAGNTIVDSISGAVGVPTGNPIGRGNTIHRIY